MQGFDLISPPWERAKAAQPVPTRSTHRNADRDIRGAKRAPTPRGVEARVPRAKGDAKFPAAGCLLRPASCFPLLAAGTAASTPIQLLTAQVIKIKFLIIPAVCASNMQGSDEFMKSIQSALLTSSLALLLTAPLTVMADDAGKPKPKPYTLTTCIVSGDKLGGDMGPPYVFVYKDKKIKDDVGRQIKFCCKSCLKDFNKDTAGYLKKIDEAEAKANK